VTALLAAALLGGCGLGAGDPPSDVALRITEDAGTRPLREIPRPEVAGEDTVARLLQRNAKVETSFSGRFVSAIDGRPGGEDADGRRRDWLYFVDGVLADRGAADVRVQDGDDVWWDRSDTGLAGVTAVVGAFPAPLAGSAAPVLGCADPATAPCAAAAVRLREAGAAARPVALDAARPSRDRAARRVLVGPWSALRRDPVAGLLAGDPRRSGVYAIVTDDGLVPLDVRGRTAPVARRWALVAALRPRGGGVTWVVTGATQADATRAAKALREPALSGRFAVALLGAGRPVGLPRPADAR
jgi:hypothetical protein